MLNTEVEEIEEKTCVNLQPAQTQKQRRFVRETINCEKLTTI